MLVLPPALASCSSRSMNIKPGTRGGGGVWGQRADSLSGGSGTNGSKQLSPDRWKWSRHS